MDAALLAASIYTTAKLPNDGSIIGEDGSNSPKTLKVTFLVSMGLFSLSLLEACPNYSLLIFDNQESAVFLTRAGRISLAGAYRILLWTLCLMITVVVPASIASSSWQPSFDKRAMQNTMASREERNRWHQGQSKPVRLISLILSSLYGVTGGIARRLGVSILRLLPRQMRALLVNKRSEELPVLNQSRLRHSPSSLRNINDTLQNHGERSCLRIGTMPCMLISVICTIWTLRSVGLTFIQRTDREGVHVLQAVVSWLCAVGVLISSILNGFGSVSMPYTCLSGHYYEPISEKALAKAEADVKEVAEMLQSKEGELLVDKPPQLRHLSRHSPCPSPRSEARKSYTEYAKVNTDQNYLLREIEFLRTLHMDMLDDLEEMKMLQRRAAAARTPVGCLMSWVGIVFSAVLIVRLALAALSILSFDAQSPAHRRDPITRVLLWLIRHEYVTKEDYAILSQCISLLLSAFFSFSQVRMFLRTVSTLNRRLCCMGKRDSSSSSSSSSSQQPSMLTRNSNTKAQLIASCMGCYFLACIVLTKMTIPMEYRVAFSQAIGGMRFNINMPAANATFAASALVSAIVLGSIFGTQRENSKRHSTIWSNSPVSPRCEV